MPSTDIEALERRLWSSADNLRANSNYASNEYFMPVMGLIFLRHAYSRFLRAKEEIEASLPSRGGKKPDLKKEDFSGRGAIYLQPEAQYDHLAGLPDSQDRSQAVVHAMELIESDYERLKGQLPKTEYQKLDNDVMGQLLRTFNDEALQQATGDVFGRIYEYFLTKFADLKAHDDGEFFTPASIVQTLVNVIEPDHGKVLDPACGSGGMFVQSAHFIEKMKEDPTKRATFYGFEKNATTIRLAKMNLAVHGLEGQITQAITYYPSEEMPDLRGQADFVMANPPFNVDEVDAAKIKTDPRLPFGLPGVSSSKKRKGKVSNGNYLWISYFYSYLNEQGRAGFVMSSQASSAGRDEKKVRQKLVETGDVDVMMAIRGGFFYTRTVPCELWFFDKDKPEERQDTVLMLDARNVHRKVTRTVYDFSPEQQANLAGIVWLYRGQQERFLALVEQHLADALVQAERTAEPLADFQADLDAFLDRLQPFLTEQPRDGAHRDTLDELKAAQRAFGEDADLFQTAYAEARTAWQESDGTNDEALEGNLTALLAGPSTDRVGAQDESGTLVTTVTQRAQQNGRGTPASRSNEELHDAAKLVQVVAERSRGLVKQADLLYRLAGRLADTCEKELDAREHDAYNRTEVNRARKQLDEARKTAVDQLKQVRYFYRHAHWLQDRFPDAVLRDVPGLVKVVSREEIADNDWSLTPGRYVGVAPPEVDEDFDFEEALREIRLDLRGLNEEAVELADTIDQNLEELGV